MLEVPASTTEITREWLTAALKSGGLLQGEIAELSLEPIGAGVGLMGELGRFHLSYQGEEQLPATMIAKCAAQNENREVARILDFYNREANFYNLMAGNCPLRLPASYYADVNQETYDFVLLMQDLGDVSPRDQLVGAAREEVEPAITRIAEMHAMHWDKADASWMYDMMSVAEAERLKELIYQPSIEPAIEKFPDFFSEEMKAVCRKVGKNYSAFWAEHVTPVDTFIHGDYRQDNMIYTDGDEDALVMDWQISGRGRGVFDVAYFMCQSVPSELRSEIEREVLELYVGRLRDSGVDYSLAQCWDDYRRIILGCLIYPVTVCGTLDTANERGKALAECMLGRNLTAIDELNCQALI